MMEAIGWIMNPGYKMQWDRKHFGDMLREPPPCPCYFAINNGIPMLNDRKMLATEDQIESKETKILEFEKREYLAQHILMSMTST